MTAGDRDRPERDDGEAGGFLSRWSRRKAEVRREQQQPDAEPAAVAMETAEPGIDPATLPSIESLTAESDFSLFLKKGVPPALRTAALRKLWLVEPSVVNYQALVEYNWDFTAPGYGELLPGDDIAKMAQRVFSGFSQDAKAEETPPATAGEEAVPQQVLPELQEQAVAAAPAVEQPAAEPVPEPEPERPPLRRRHGGALPS